MATKEYYLGSVGPLMYEDSDEYPDSSPGSELYHHALRGEQILIETAPTLEDHVLRKSDMPDFSSMNAEKGDILYFDGTNWVVLHHGDIGQVLKTGGHDGIPAWDDEELDDLSDVAITSAERGDILYRNASGWVNLHHGTDGQILTTKGDGADPIWADPPTSGAEDAWPIGSVFLSVVATDPATLLGFGTWARIAEGLVLVGYKAGDPDFGTVEGTGGAKTHTLTSDEMPSHTHVQDAHSHGLSDVRKSTSGSDTTNAQWGSTSNDASSTKTTIITDSATATNQNTGGGAAHNNLPPFVVVYVWKRTA